MVKKFQSTICRYRKCTICPLITKEGKIKCKRTKETFRTRTKVSCKSNNLIYAIECTRCQAQYVGETGRTIAARLYNHFSTISCNELHKPVPAHYCKQNGHNGRDDFKVHILEFLQTPPDKKHKKHRERAERKWQDRLRTSYPWGLNREDAIPDDKD